MKQIQTVVIQNEPITSDFYRLEGSVSDFETPIPGQFLTIRVSEDSVPLLRRPFAYSGVDSKSGDWSMIYQRRGRATELLSGKKVGDTLDIIAPLGKPFPMPPQDKKPVLVAGGIGLGPVLFLAEHLKKQGREFSFVFGARTGSAVPQWDKITSLKPIVCTDDGSLGFKGNTAEYLKSSNCVDNNSVIYCCGPMPMLKACHVIAQEKKIECWVSVEQIMACGVGACMGCVVKVHKEPGYARACKEGPVFNSNEIVWE